IQRYEADRYRAISLSNYRRIAGFLGVSLTAHLDPGSEKWLGLMQPSGRTYTNEELRKVVRHAEERGWFFIPESEHEQYAALLDYVSETSDRYGSPTLLRTGLNTEDLAQDVALIAWRARVTRIAEAELEATSDSIEFLDITWLRELTRLSRETDGP